MKAFVDIGSPGTIVSLKFLVWVLTKQKKPDESFAQWHKHVEQRFEPLGPHLKSLQWRKAKHSVLN